MTTQSRPGGATGSADRYARVERMIATDQCVILDGANGTELIKVRGGPPEVEEQVWGLNALLDAPDEVTRVHRSYIDVGCDVICTNTWGLPTALRDPTVRLSDSSEPVHWMDIARRAVGLARSAAADAGRADEVAVAFSLNGDVDTRDGRETIQLLSRAFEEEPPDLILLETLSLVRTSTYATVEALLDTGIPLWLSFRRCRHGVCGVYGEHWGGPEGDAFGRAARRFEEMGVGALAINCVPPDHVAGMLSWLRDFTDLPLGVYPNLGYLSAAGWREEPGVKGSEYAQLALSWRAEGAQVVGGCCGVRPEHLQAAREILAETKPGHERPTVLAHENGKSATQRRLPTWADPRGRQMFPLDLPEIEVGKGVFVPTQGSFLAWKYLYREGVGAHQRCLDVGCGCGLLTVQLARNGAAHVHAIDIDDEAARNTLTNAFRNGVADRVSASAQDLYPWVPEERYDVIVASLYQTPVDPFEQVMTHRPLDYWGRNLLDHLIRMLPEALADDGTAYVMQLSIIGQRRTAELLDRLGFQARVVDFSFFEFSDLFNTKREQLARVEEQSDAYHLRFGTADVMVAYLLEITRKSKENLRQ
ncbi:MAG TPA: homocysteine S-methyltransferase family protein [Solirubrobacteraceae bacterium]|jgi:S-methylmethionine-dependent homocysteine/selenocysteine methylase/SAM-dependent methyltransferase|nr:homocysteine S-methyltransferase family protein [Solirubrobacteraceae bacterium]